VAPAQNIVELAQVLDVEVRELEWLADPRRYLRRASRPRLGHYHRVWMPKASGAGVVERDS
jgi:hypothetical protein